MKPIYKHYKNKLYKYLGVARHSETLEELALYEALYENNQGQIWVRPKNMFFEKIQKEEQELDRFAHQQINITSILVDLNLLQKNDPLLNQVLNLYAALYGSNHAVTLVERLLLKKNPHILVAELQQKVLGFRIGYESQNQAYTFWMDGIHPQYRNLEMGPYLLNQEITWAQKNGYQKIRALINNNSQQKIIMLLDANFKITGTHTEAHKNTRVILEKPLNLK